MPRAAEARPCLPLRGGLYKRLETPAEHSCPALLLCQHQHNLFAMKLLVVCALVSVAVAAKLEGLEKEPIAIVRMNSENNEDGSFQYGFETANNIQTEVQGQLKQIGEEFGTVMRGSYSFVTPEGQTVSITWVADENGFQAEGDAIPKAPEV